MFTRTRVLPHLILSVVCSATVLSQQTPAEPTFLGVQEFPVILQQSLEAGKTPVGTKIQAKLEVATLLSGTVIPRSAVLSGEVVESAAKTKTGPSRLAIRVDSMQWKNGSASVKVYLTRWYYPTMTEEGPDLRYGPEQPAKKTWNGMGQYPDPNSPAYRPFPGNTSDQNATAPGAPASVTSNRRAPMKNVESEQSGDGVLAIVSKKTNIKLDKLTMYVLATGDLLPPPAKSAVAK